MAGNVIINRQPFKCVDVFFRCLETLPGDGTGAMIDTKRGATYSPIPTAGPVPIADTYWLENSDGASNSILPSCLSSIPLAAGSWPNWAQKSVITFATGRVMVPNKVRTPFGNGDTVIPGSDGNISVSFGGGMHTVIRDANGNQVYISSEPARALPAIGTDVGVIVEYQPATTDGITVTPGWVRSRVVDVNGNTFGSGSTETMQYATVQNVFDLNPSLNNKTRFGGLAFYSILAFSFNDGIPANREAAYLWMLKNHPAGNRSLPPQFRYTE